MNSIISIQSLSKSYPIKGKEMLCVYDNFSLEVPKTDHFICLTGPDGAGKSTLLKLLAGVLKLDSGLIRVNALEPKTTNPDFTKQIGYMSQTLGLYGELSVLDNLRIFSGLKGLNLKENEDYLLDLLKKVNLLPFKDRNADDLSGGMKQKLGLTCAIAPKPQILILDEPTVGVDPVSRKELWDIIYDYIGKSDAYCIFSSAYLEEAAKSDLTLMMEQGKVVMQGHPSDLANITKGQTYSLDLKNENYQITVRKVMSISARCIKDSPLIDVVPRLSKIDILTRKQSTKDEILYYLKDKLGLDFEISQRDSLLEDSYIYQCFLDKKQIDTKNSSAIVEIKGYDKNAPVVSVENIKKKFGDFTAVRHSSFKVHKGEIFGLLGPNGAGKTTTFRMICALLKPTEGSVLINGFNLEEAADDARATIGYVSQKFSLYRKLTIYQNLQYFGLSYGLKPPYLNARIQELLDEFSLRAFVKTKSEDLPFGIQRQLSMACALIHKPKILFLDEATSGADPLSRRIFWDRVSALSNEGTCVIVTTHFMEESEYCDNFLIQDKGKILVLGAPDQICIKDGKRISIEETFVKLINEFRLKEDK